MKTNINIRNCKGQSSSIYLFFLLIMLIPIFVLFAAPLFSTVGSFGMQTSGATGVVGLILDNLNIILFISILYFIIMWVR